MGSSTYGEYIYDSLGPLIGLHKRSTWQERFFPFGPTPLAKHAGGTTFDFRVCAR